MPTTSEDRLIAWLRREAQGAGGESIGDDTAFLELRGALAVTTDSQIEGTHFPSGLAPGLLARRLLAVNLSDLAAVGARPTTALLALAAPSGFGHKPFFRSLLTACRRQGVQLVGGDLATSPRIVATLTLMGARTGGSWVERSAARAGQQIWVGGTLGESALGCHLVSLGARIEGRRVILPEPFASQGSQRVAAARRAVRRHVQPTPQLALGAWLAGRRQRAGMDISDGLAIDLHRLCRASGVGARVDANLLPHASQFEALCQLANLSPEELALGGGEDYVLLFTLPRSVRPPTDRFPEARPIGSITEDRRLRLIHASRNEELRPTGWDHLLR